MRQNTLKEKLEMIMALANECLKDVEGKPSNTLGNVVSSKNMVRKPKSATGCVGAILELVDEGFFDEPKSLAQVMEKFMKQGQSSFRDTSVSMNLLNLVKPPRKILARDGAPQKWVYSKKK